MNDIRDALNELNKLDESSDERFDRAWIDKFGPDDTIVMTPEQFFKELKEMRDFDESK